jgi:hypothetical protein
LVVVNEEMHALVLRVLAAFRIVKADKAVGIAHFWNKARRVEFTRTAINHFIQIFIIASLPVDQSAVPPICKNRIQDTGGKAGGRTVYRLSRVLNSML